MERGQLALREALEPSLSSRTPRRMSTCSLTRCWWDVDTYPFKTAAKWLAVTMCPQALWKAGIILNLKSTSLRPRRDFHWALLFPKQVYQTIASPNPLVLYVFCWLILLQQQLTIYSAFYLFVCYLLNDRSSALYWCLLLEKLNCLPVEIIFTSWVLVLLNLLNIRHFSCIYIGTSG